jgi:glycosyltransferase involved in cell wall biosynthesis
VLQLTPCAAWIVSEYQRAAPYARFVQDHTLFCPGLNKLLADGTPCRSPLGRACLERYFLGEGCHGFRAASGRRPVWKAIQRLRVKRREFALHERAQLLLVASEYMRDELMAAGAPPEHVVVLPYATRAATGVTPPLALPEGTQAFLAPHAGEGAVLVTPARLALPDKGVDRLLEILERIAHPFRAVIAGSGPAREQLDRAVAERGLSSRVHFSGWLDAGQMESLYRAADAVLFPSTWDEPFGLGGIEAMAHGVPVVAFDVGGVRQWLEDGVGGWRLPRGDQAAFARAVERLIDEPEVAERAGASGRVRVERDFRYEVHTSRLESLLEGCLRGSSAKGQQATAG